MGIYKNKKEDKKKRKKLSFFLDHFLRRVLVFLLSCFLLKNSHLWTGEHEDGQSNLCRSLRALKEAEFIKKTEIKKTRKQERDQESDQENKKTRKKTKEICVGRFAP